jgi:hypothetical protein
MIRTSARLRLARSVIKPDFVNNAAISRLAKPLLVG